MVSGDTAARMCQECLGGGHSKTPRPHNFQLPALEKLGVEGMDLNKKKRYVGRVHE